MDDVMVTGRMPADKKKKGANVLRQEGLNASQAIGLMYDRLIEKGDAQFLLPDEYTSPDDVSWANAARFIDSLSSKKESRFDEMSKSEIKRERLRTKNQA